MAAVAAAIDASKLRCCAPPEIKAQYLDSLMKRAAGSLAGP
jgi:hypothetical protein